MQEMNREIAEMIGELQLLEHRKKANGIDDARHDRYGFDMETPEMFSMEPLGFVETTMRLQTEAMELFNMVGRVSRFSPLFPRMSAQLERMVYRLGSCCLTKAVLEQQAGESFLLLEGLTIGWLRGMTAFNFRKCYASFMESRAEGGYRPEAFELSVRWAALDKRLQATGGKIEKIRSGQIKIEPAGEEKPAEPRKESAADREPCADAAPIAPNSKALPIDMAAVNGAAALRNEAPRETGEIPGSVKCGPRPFDSEPELRPDVPSSVEDADEAEVVSDPEATEEEFMRDVLLNDALLRVDREAYEAAVLADGAGIRDLWDRYLEREERTGFTHLKRLGLAADAGPPDFEEEEVLSGQWPVGTRNQK